MEWELLSELSESEALARVKRIFDDDVPQICWHHPDRPAVFRSSSAGVLCKECFNKYMDEQKRERTQRANKRKLVIAETVFTLGYASGIPLMLWLDAWRIVSLAISSIIYPVIGLVSIALLFGYAYHLHVGLFEKQKVPELN